MDTSHIYAAAGGVKATEARSDKSATTICHNLRPVIIPPGSSMLAPTEPPAIVSDSQLKPLGCLNRDDSQMVVVADGGRLGLVDSSSGEITDLGEYGNEIFCALTSDSRLTVSTDRGITELSSLADDLRLDWLECDSRQWPELSLVAVEGADCSSTVDSRELSVDYSSVGTPLSDSDRRAVTSDLKRAYCDVATQAAAQGAYCAPVIMHYRLVGHNGDTLFTSPPLLLGPSDSARLTASIAVTSADRRTLDSYCVEARAWWLRLIGAGEVPQAMAAAVSRIEVLAAPQFHPFDPDGDAAINLVWRAADKTMMRITMPGAGRSVSSGNPLAGESRLRRMLSVLPAVECVVAVVQGPFAPGDMIDVMPVIMPAFGSVTEECKATEKALNLSPDTSSAALRRLSWPHCFTARCGAAAAGSVLWGGLSAHRFDGFRAKMFSASPGGEGSWHAAVSVTFASGDECVVAVSEGTGASPLMFNPLLSYPSPDAVEMTLVVSSGGSVRRMTVPLTPDASGQRSTYVHNSFAPFALSGEADAFVIPPERVRSHSMPGYVALAAEATPAAVTAAASIGDTEVSSLFAASRSQSSWDFSKTRFSALTAAGVYTVTVTPGATPRLSVGLVDTRVPAGANAGVEASGKILVVLERSLVEVGVSHCKTIKDLSTILGSDISQPLTVNCAFDSHRQELWLSTPSGSTVISLTDLTAFTRDEIITGRAAGNYALIGGKLCDLSRDRQAESVYVRWCGRISAGNSYIRPTSLIFDIRSPLISYGELSVRRMSLNDAEPEPSLRMTIDGAVGSPVLTAFPAMPFRSLEFSFQARVSPTTILRALTINQPLT